MRAFAGPPIVLGGVYPVFDPFKPCRHGCETGQRGVRSTGEGHPGWRQRGGVGAMQFQMGVPVMAEDGRAGTLDRLIFDPATEEVRGLVVVQGGLLPHDVVVPLERVVSADGEAVRVRGTVEEIASLEGFTQAQFTEPPEDWLPPADLEVRAPYFLFPASPYAVGAFAPGATINVPADEAEENKPAGSVDLS